LSSHFESSGQFLTIESDSLKKKGANREIFRILSFTEIESSNNFMGMVWIESSMQFFIL